jgi:hypothetical protein
MHSDASGVEGPSETDSPRWLNAVDAVDEVVRGFAVGVVNRYGASREAGPDLSDFMAWLDWRCRQLNSLFLGRDVGVARQHG